MRRVLAFIAGLLTAAPALAGQKSMINVGPWAVGAFYDDSSGAFTHCTALATYANGNALSFAVDGNGTDWRLGLINLSWKLPQGASYQLGLSIDGSRPVAFTGYVSGPNIIVIELPPTAAAFTALRNGNLLTVGANGGLFQFGLKGTAAALKATLSCAQLYGQVLAQINSENPFEDAKQDQDPAMSPAFKKEAVSVASGLLKDIGLADVKVSEATDGSIAWFQAFWSSNSNIGGLTIKPDLNQEQAIAAMTGATGTLCKSGSYGVIRQPPKVHFIQARAACKGGANDFTMEFLSFDRRDGGSYTITVFGDASTLSTPSTGAEQPASSYEPR